MKTLPAMPAPLPRIAITMGDVAGIGPEVVARACADPRLAEVCRPVVIGHPELLRRAVELTAAPLGVRPVYDFDELPDVAEGVPCWNPAGDEALSVAPGTLDGRAGEAAFQYLIAAIGAARSRRVDAITTAPLNKAALHLAGRNYPGHTEILAEACGVRNYAMMLYLPPGGPVRSPHGLGVAHVTLHTPLRSVPELLSTDRIAEKVALIARFMQDVGCPRPRIAVCALNPHAGEEGLFGDEEPRIIAPAVERARAGGLDATGPLPADTLLRRAVGGEFDGVVAMYHDQGHIAFKLIGFDRAVNVTLGLPIVRTSPSHGTAFDIAWTGQARADGLLEAMRVATLLARSQNSSLTNIRQERRDENHG